MRIKSQKEATCFKESTKAKVNKYCGEEKEMTATCVTLLSYGLVDNK